MLIRLIKGIVDPNPALRSRLVSAIVLGGNLTVPKGKTRITLTWTAPTTNEFFGGELFKNPDGSAASCLGT